ncbi:hypothetical protein DXG01_009617, partial [Tephrocybe rancida]
LPHPPVMSSTQEESPIPGTYITDRYNRNVTGVFPQPRVPPSPQIPQYRPPNPSPLGQRTHSRMQPLEPSPQFISNHSPPHPNDEYSQYLAAPSETTGNWIPSISQAYAQRPPATVSQDYTTPTYDITSFGTPRYPGPNEVIQTPYQNQDPHDPHNIPLPTSERLWTFGYTGSSAIPPSTTDTYYHREREGWIATGESFPQPNFYPQQTAQYQQVAPHLLQPPVQQVIQNTLHGQHQPTGQVAQYVQQSTLSNLPYLVSRNPTPQTTPNYLSRSYPLPEGVYDVAMDRVLTAIRITPQAFCNQAQDLLN